MRVRWHSGDLRIPRALPDAAVLTRELQEFRVKYTDAGNATFNAREGERDDLMLVLAIAVFGWSESPCRYLGVSGRSPVGCSGRRQAG